MARAFHLKKRLGQNFLVDPEALQAVSNALRIENSDLVVEIGPGLGFLTQYLSQSGALVNAVELDNECVADLRQMKMPNVTITHKDFLQYDIGTAGGEGPTSQSLRIVGNVPYQITTPIIAHIFGEIGQPQPWLNRVKSVVLTVQLEVAQRFVALPNSDDYSQVTLLVNYFAKAELLRKISSDSFFPQPQVNSAIVRFIPLPEPPVVCGNHRLLRQVIRAGFSQRRKMFKNNLSFLHCDEKELLAAFQEARIDPLTRAETLSLSQFGKLTDALDSRVERAQESKPTESH